MRRSAATLRRVPSNITLSATPSNASTSRVIQPRWPSLPANGIASNNTSICCSSTRYYSSTASTLYLKPSLTRQSPEQWSSSSSSSSSSASPSTNSSSSRDPFPPPPPPAPRRRSNSRASQPLLNPSAKKESEARASSTPAQHKATTQARLSAQTAAEEKAPSVETVASPGNSEKKAGKAHTDLTASTTPASPAKSTTATPKSLRERIKGLWENVKYLFRFYYNGVKQIWTDRALVADLRKQIAEREAAGQTGILWRENAIIELHRADVRKLPLFLAILLILEEILPLVVIYAPSLLPSTCILPSQSQKMRSGEERTRGMAIQRLAGDANVRAAVEKIANGCSDCVEERERSTIATATKSASSSEVESSPPKNVADLTPTVLKDVANIFGLRTWGPASLVTSRIQSHLRALRKDDELLHQAWLTRHEPSLRNSVSKGSSSSSESEWDMICKSDWLWRACARRGLRSSEASDADMQRNLEAYLHLVSLEQQQTQGDGASVHHALIPLALYDGTPRHLHRLQGEFSEEHAKGLRERTKEVVQSVVQEEKRKEGVE